MDSLHEITGEVNPGRPLTWQESVSQLGESVRENLNALLNTRRLSNPIPEEFKLCSESLLAFGLPDFTSLNVANPEDEGCLRSAIELAISRFEPRLTGVTVTRETRKTETFVLHFRVDAWLQIEPTPEAITFETLFQADRGHFLVVDGR